LASGNNQSSISNEFRLEDPEKSENPDDPEKPEEPENPEFRSGFRSVMSSMIMMSSAGQTIPDSCRNFSNSASFGKPVSRKPDAEGGNPVPFSENPESGVVDVT